MSLPIKVAAACFTNFTGRPIRLHAVTPGESASVILVPFACEAELESEPAKLPERVEQYVRGKSEHLQWAQRAFGAGMPLVGLVSHQVTNLEFVWHTARNFSCLKTPPKHMVMLRRSTALQARDRPSTVREGGIGLLNLSTVPQTLVVQPARIVPPLLRESPTPTLERGRLTDLLWHALPKGDHRLLPRYRRLAADKGWLVITVDQAAKLDEDWSDGHPVFDAVISWAQDVLGWDGPPLIVLQPVTDKEAFEYAQKPRFQS